MSILAFPDRRASRATATVASDAITRNELRVAFGTMRRGLHLTAVLVTHDIGEAITLGDRIAVMRRGRVEQLAEPAELLAHP
ncbi:MAG: hypothetical protein IIC29_05420, partial [Chloroflexi bacterium]|nr:hypothetical protein [Chloroflexota bacterium]